MPTILPPSDVISAYRLLYRSGLHAVQFAKPARYTLRDIIRKAFRTEPPSCFDRERLGNTVLFLQNAARETGMEHKILKNLIFTRYWEAKYRLGVMDSANRQYVKTGIRRNSYQHFEITLKMLNESMHMCLR
ncbi:MAG: hypothetical protein MMC33_005118 [Icmadophila ericetorum]|nr:hypothetical protein [Icmadophila ericetorum]